MNRSTFLKALCAVPVLGSALARVVPAASAQRPRPEPRLLHLAMVGGPRDSIVLERHEALGAVSFPYVPEPCAFDVDFLSGTAEPVFREHTYRWLSGPDASGWALYRFVEEEQG